MRHGGFVKRFLNIAGPIKLLAGKPESRNAGMLRERKIFERPSFPASQLQAYYTNNSQLGFNSIGVLFIAIICIESFCEV
jgi:hypothetical protein